MEPKVREYLTKLRQQAFLEIKDGYVDTGAAPGKDTRWHEVVGLKPETTTKEEVAAHRHRPKFLGVIPHGSVAPGTKETSGSAVPTESAAAAAPTPAAPAGTANTAPRQPPRRALRLRLQPAASAPAASEPGVVTKPRKILGVIPHGTEQATAKPPKPEKPKAPPQPIKQ